MTSTTRTKDLLHRNLVASLQNIFEEACGLNGENIALEQVQLRLNDLSSNMYIQRKGPKKAPKSLERFLQNAQAKSKAPLMATSVDDASLGFTSDVGVLLIACDPYRGMTRGKFELLLDVLKARQGKLPTIIHSQFSFADWRALVEKLIPLEMINPDALKTLDEFMADAETIEIEPLFELASNYKK